MTRYEIIDAAFSVWAREGYRKESLADLSRALGVTKPALYRHFSSKEDLKLAMKDSFFDLWVQEMGDRTATDSGTLAEDFARFFASRPELFTYAVLDLFRKPSAGETFAQELTKRGFPLRAPEGLSIEEKERNSFAVTGSMFSVAIAFFGSLHSQVLVDEGTRPDPTEGEGGGVCAGDSQGSLIAEKLDGAAGVNSVKVGAFARDLVLRGLAFSVAIGDTRKAQLRSLARLSSEETGAKDPILPAAAAAIAEAGPWNASMELVAKKAGFSKSGLYAHYNSKEELFARLVSDEFERMASLMGHRSSCATLTEERFYLAFTAVANYLTARPDILVAMNWVRIQRIALGDLFPTKILPHFSFLQEGAKKGRCRLITGSLETSLRWAAFQTIRHLVLHAQGGDQSNSEETIDRLMTLIAQGLGGSEYGV